MRPAEAASRPPVWTAAPWSAAATVTGTSRPAAFQKCGTTMLIRPRAIWSRSRVAPIWRNVSSSRACRVGAGSRNCSSAGGGIRMITSALGAVVASAHGLDEPTVTTRRVPGGEAQHLPWPPGRCGRRRAALSAGNLPSSGNLTRSLRCAPSRAPRGEVKESGTPVMLDDPSVLSIPRISVRTDVSDRRAMILRRYPMSGHAARRAQASCPAGAVLSRRRPRHRHDRAPKGRDAPAGWQPAETGQRWAGTGPGRKGGFGGWGGGFQHREGTPGDRGGQPQHGHLGVVPAPAQAGGDGARRGRAVGAGGKGANQAVAAARLGAAVRMVGCSARTGRSGCRGAGATRGWSCRGAGGRAGAHGVALISVDPAGENSIIVAPAANGLVGRRGGRGAGRGARRAGAVGGDPVQVLAEALGQACAAGCSRAQPGAGARGAARCWPPGWTGWWSTRPRPGCCGPAGNRPDGAQAPPGPAGGRCTW